MYFLFFINRCFSKNTTVHKVKSPVQAIKAMEVYIQSNNSILCQVVLLWPYMLSDIICCILAKTVQHWLFFFHLSSEDFFSHFFSFFSMLHTCSYFYASCSKETKPFIFTGCKGAARQMFTCTTNWDEINLANLNLHTFLKILSKL